MDTAKIITGIVLAFVSVFATVILFVCSFGPPIDWRALGIFIAVAGMFLSMLLLHEEK